MHALSCSSSFEENAANSLIVTRTHKHLARVTIHGCSTGRRRSCLDSDRCEEPSERFGLCACDLGRGEYHSDEEIYSGCPFRQ